MGVLCCVLWQKCDLSEPLKNVNGKPIVPILNERTLPKFLETARMEKTVNRNSTRLKLFSGTANPALSQVKMPFFFVNQVIFNKYLCKRNKAILINGGAMGGLGLCHHILYCHLTNKSIYESFKCLDFFYQQYFGFALL